MCQSGAARERGVIRKNAALGHPPTIFWGKITARMDEQATGPRHQILQSAAGNLHGSGFAHVLGIFYWILDFLPDPGAKKKIVNVRASEKINFPMAFHIV